MLGVVSNNDPAVPGFNDTTDATLLDNGVGVQRDVPGLPLGSTTTFQVTWRFRHFTPLALTLAATAKAQGQVATATVTARNSDGNPDAGRSVLYAISGPNFGGGETMTGADGTATISWVGANAGTDTLTAFIDANGNRTRDPDEPEQSAAVTFGAPLPPVPGKSVVVKVVSGTVLVKYPAGYVPRATGPSAGFVPFKGAANIPVGSQLDTSKGRVALTSAADTGGAKTQTSDFYQGIFQVKQSPAQEEAQEAGSADHRPGHEGSDRAVAVRAVEGRARRGCVGEEEEEGAEVGARQAVGQRQGQVPHLGQVQLGDGARDDLAGRGSLRRNADQGVARDGERARHQAQEDGDGEGRAQLPRARAARREQEQAAG